MKKIVDIILDKLNNNTLYTDKIFGFLAYYYDNELKGNKKNDKCIEKYKQEIENIFLERSNNPTLDLPKKVRNLAIEVAKNIKSKDLPQITDRSVVFLILAIILGLAIILMFIRFYFYYDLLNYSEGEALYYLQIVFFVLSIVFLQCFIIIRINL